MILFQVIGLTNNLPERYNESILKKTDLTLKQNKNVMKKPSLI